MICPKLDGNACGSYGVTIEYKNKNEKDGDLVDICYNSRSSKRLLRKGQSAEVSLWRMQESALDDVNVECYFWCSKDGGLPSGDENDDKDGGAGRILLDKLVSTKFAKCIYRYSLFCVRVRSLTVCTVGSKTVE